MIRAIDLGLVALAVAIVAGVLVAIGAVPSTVAVVVSDALVLAFGGLAVVAGLATLYRAAVDDPSDAREADATAVSTPLGSPHDPSTDDGDDRVDGRSFRSSIAGPGDPQNREYVDETFRRALERPAVGLGSGYGERSYHRREARSQVLETAVAVLADRHDVDEEAAATAIREGTWTDDPRAAAFLSSGTQVPLRTRLIDWAYGVRYRRNLAAAVREIERLAEGGTLERGGEADRQVPRSRGADSGRDGDPHAGPRADDYGADDWLEEAGAEEDGAVDPTDLALSTGDTDALGTTETVDATQAVDAADAVDRPSADDPATDGDTDATGADRERPELGGGERR